MAEPSKWALAVCDLALQQALHASVRDRAPVDTRRFVALALDAARREALEGAIEIVRRWRNPRAGIVLARHPGAALDEIEERIRVLADKGE